MITKNLIKLCAAMAEFEGWKPDGNFDKPAKFPSVAYRNHNPGNLRSSVFELGKRDGFAFFISDTVGMFAMQYDIMQKARGKTVTTLTGNSTIADLISIYACVKDEQLQNYLNHITRMTGFDQFMQLKDIIK